MKTEIDPRKAAEGFAFLVILERKTGGRVYAGTVPHHVTARRRAANRVARVSRRAGR
jgi:hypothetical protein